VKKKFPVGVGEYSLYIEDAKQWISFDETIPISYYDEITNNVSSVLTKDL
jgi:hypothetical protein